MQVAPCAFRMRIRPVQKRSIKGSYLGGLYFYQFFCPYLLSLFVFYVLLAFLFSAFASILVYDIFL
jgi:hypothetical protein